VACWLKTPAFNPRPKLNRSKANTSGGKIMDRSRVLTVGGALLIGAIGLPILLPQLNKGEVFIAGDQPVNSEPVRQKLQLAGWSNIQIARKGAYIEAIASKDGQESKIWVDARTGRLRVFDDDDDGNDDDDDD
jgi:hypothetical protein